MTTRFIKQLIAAIFATLVLFMVGLGIWLFMKNSQTLQDILFWVGAAPLALYSIGIMGGFAGRGDSSYQLSRSVSNRSSTQRTLQEVNTMTSRMTSGLNWCIGGLLLILLSILI